MAQIYVVTMDNCCFYISVCVVLKSARGEGPKQYQNVMHTGPESGTYHLSFSEPDKASTEAKSQYFVKLRGRGEDCNYYHVK